MTDKQEPADVESVELNEQPALPTLELPDYHGRKPVGMKSSVNGASNRLSRPHGIGDRLTVVVEAVVKKAGHEQTDDGLIYTETLKVDDMFEIQGDAGARLLSTVRSLHRTSADTVEGRRQIDGLGDVGYTDASGVALLPDEVDKIREAAADPVRAMLDESRTPVVVKYESGTRMVWPDEYEPDEARPELGEAHPDDHAEGVDADRVVELLHHATGETIARVDDSAEVPVPDVSTRRAEPETDEDEVDEVDPWDDVEPYDAPASEPVSNGAETLPLPQDFGMVDTTVPKLREIVSGIADRVLLVRLRRAEEQGRGRGLIPRAGALAAIDAAIAELNGGFFS